MSLRENNTPSLRGVLYRVKGQRRIDRDITRLMKPTNAEARLRDSTPNCRYPKGMIYLRKGKAPSIGKKGKSKE